MPKTEKEEPMVMAISWMSPIKEEEEPNSNPNQVTEEETEDLRDGEE